MSQMCPSPRPSHTAHLQMARSGATAWLHLLPPESRPAASVLSPNAVERWTVAWQIQGRRPKVTPSSRAPEDFGGGEGGGRQGTCAAVLVLLALPVQHQGEHHQQHDDQAGQGHHQQEPPLLIERGFYFSCGEDTNTVTPTETSGAVVLPEPGEEDMETT